MAASHYPVVLVLWGVASKKRSARRPLSPNIKISQPGGGSCNQGGDRQRAGWSKDLVQTGLSRFPKSQMSKLKMIKTLLSAGNQYQCSQWAVPSPFSQDLRRPFLTGAHDCPKKIETRIPRAPLAVRSSHLFPKTISIPQNLPLSWPTIHCSHYTSKGVVSVPRYHYNGGPAVSCHV